MYLCYSSSLNRACLGESSDAVHVAVRDMRHEQDLGLMCGFTCISSLFIATTIQCWANYEAYIAGTLSVIYGTGLFIFVSTGIHTFRIFQLNYNISKFHLKKDRGNTLFVFIQ